jgi:hypothetical protein
MGCSDVAKIDALIRVSQAFETNGVHLTPASGKLFVYTTLFNLATFFSAIMINLEEEQNNDMERCIELDEDTETNKESDQINKIIRAVEAEIEKLKEDLRQRRIHDSTITSRIREELDFQANIRKEDRIIMTGLSSQTPMRHSAEEKRDG